MTSFRILFLPLWTKSVTDRYIFFIAFIFISITAFAQQDTTRQIKDKLTKADSSAQRFNNKVDSIQRRVNNLANPNLRLGTLSKKIKLDKRKEKKDSLQFVKQVEKEKQRIKTEIADAQQSGKSTAQYEHQLDSLDKVTYQRKSKTLWTSGIQSGKNNLTHKTDSLKGSITVPANPVNAVESKISGVEQKVNAPVNKVEGTVNEKLGLINKESGPGSNIPSNAAIPDASVSGKLNGTDLKLDDPLGKVNSPLENQMGEAGKVKDQLNDAKSLPQDQINKVKSIDEVKTATGELGKVNSITDKAQDYTGDAKNIAQGNLNEVKDVPKAIEGQVTKIDELKGLQKDAGQFDQYSKMTNSATAQQELKKEAIEEMTNVVAVDHFAGKEEALKAAMDKMSKLKLKYPSVNTLKDITKRVVNEMNGKPLIERLVPGITLQIQKSGDFLIDYNPLLGFRVSGKLTVGAGWNERFNIGRHFHFSLDDRIYGPRIFGDLKIGKGFSFRTDIEKMNTYVPSIATTGLTGDGHRTWVWSAFIGLKKEYKFWGSVKGNAQFLYNLYDDHYNSPYADRFAVRTGFEFPMKKKIN